MVADDVADDVNEVVAVVVTVVDCEFDCVLEALVDWVEVCVVDGDVTSQLSASYEPSTIPSMNVFRLDAKRLQSAVRSLFSFGRI